MDERNGDAPAAAACPVCGGGAGPLGRLGRRRHWLCRACGAQWSTTAGAEEVDDGDRGG